MKMLLRVCLSVFVMWGSSGMRCQSTHSDQPLEEHVRYAQSADFSHSLVMQHVNTIAMHPHPLGSDRQFEVRNYLFTEVQALGFAGQIEPFIAEVPNPAVLHPSTDTGPLTLTLQGNNVHAFHQQHKDCVIYVASHYDTKRIPEFTYVGANDSASSSSALLWLLFALSNYSQPESLQCDFAAVWFDGEESYLTGWTDGERFHPAQQQDNTYGSRFLASQLTPCLRDEASLCLPAHLGGQQLRALILLDLIGNPDVRLTRDVNSSEALLDRTIALSGKLGLSSLYSNSRLNAIEDDHIPFATLGIPVVNLIDFENLHVWHQPGDTAERVDSGSIEKVSRLALALALDVAINGL